MAESWWQIVISFSYGLFGSVIPVMNAEAFIVAMQATGLLHPLPLGLSLGLGQGVGKAILFWLVRRGSTLPWVRRQVAVAKPARSNSSFTRGLKRINEYARTKRGVTLGAFCAGAISVPPNYPLTIWAGATGLPMARFIIPLGAGFIIRAIVESFALMGVFSSWFS